MYDRTILLGVALSLLFTELTGLSPGGIIVPGYMALCLHSPLRIGYTLLISLGAFGAVRLLGRAMILYGRRRFALLVLLAYILHLAVAGLHVLPFAPDVIGVLIPGIIAREFDRQGVAKTMLGLAVVTLALALALLAFGMNAPGI